MRKDVKGADPASDGKSAEQKDEDRPTKEIIVLAFLARSSVASSELDRFHGPATNSILFHEPSRGASNELPQPQLRTAFGLVILKPAPLKPSVKSTVAPFKKSAL